MKIVSLSRHVSRLTGAISCRVNGRRVSAALYNRVSDNCESDTFRTRQTRTGHAHTKVSRIPAAFPKLFSDLVAAGVKL